MKPSLREILADSHVAAVTIVVLLLWSIDSAFRALWDPLYAVLSFLFTAVAILDIPYISAGPGIMYRPMWIMTSFYLFSSITCLFTARLLSRWAYGMGPLRSLSQYRVRIGRSPHA